MGGGGEGRKREREGEREIFVNCRYNCLEPDRRNQSLENLIEVYAYNSIQANWTSIIFVTRRSNPLLLCNVAQNKWSKTFRRCRRRRRCIAAVVVSVVVLVSVAWFDPRRSLNNDIQLTVGFTFGLNLNPQETDAGNA